MGKIISIDFKSAKRSNSQELTEAGQIPFDDNYYRDWSLPDLRRESVRFSNLLSKLSDSLPFDICDNGIHLYEALAYHAETDEIKAQALAVVYRLRQNLNGTPTPDDAA
jgi:hypothetical protein